MIADTNGQRTAGASFTNNSGDNRRFQTRHDLQVPGNGLTLAALFGIDARIRAGGVDKGQDRHLEALGHFHQAAGLAVAFRLGHAEVAAHLFLYVTAFLVTDDHHRPAVQARNAADDGGIIGKMAIAVQLFKVGKNVTDIIQRIGPLRVARHLGNLPAAQVAENALGQGLALLLQPSDFFGDVQRVVTADQTQLFDLGLQVRNWLFKLQVFLAVAHRHPSSACARSGHPKVSQITLRDCRAPVEHPALRYL